MLWLHVPGMLSFFLFFFFFEVPNFFGTCSYARDSVYFLCEEPNTGVKTHEGITSTVNIILRKALLFFAVKGGRRKQMFKEPIAVNDRTAKPK